MIQSNWGFKDTEVYSDDLPPLDQARCVIIYLGVYFYYKIMEGGTDPGTIAQW